MCDRLMPFPALCSAPDGAPGRFRASKIPLSCRSARNARAIARERHGTKHEGCFRGDMTGRPCPPASIQRPTAGFRSLPQMSPKGRDSPNRSRPSCRHETFSFAGRPERSRSGRTGAETACASRIPEGNLPYRLFPVSEPVRTAFRIRTVDSAPRNRPRTGNCPGNSG